MQETVKQSKTVLDATIKASELDQRAWVGILDPIPPAFQDEFGKPIYVKEGCRTTFGVIINNFGKSPAIKVTIKVALSFTSADEEFSPFLFMVRPQKSGAVIQPQEKLSVPIETDIFSDTRQIVLTKNGQKILYLYGTILYDDIFKKPHVTIFCMYLAPSLNSFTPCKTFNDAE